MQLITLTGNKEENYYQLGLKDRENCNEIFETISSLIKSTNTLTNKIKNISSGIVFKKNMKSFDLVKAYAEGLKRSESEVTSFLITPDIISGLTSIYPNIPRLLFGCSSYFFKNNNDNVSHFRILDFPLGNSYTTHERFIKYAFKGEQQYCGISTAGFPFPSITSMSQSGLSFALHQKFGHVFNPDGSPIFEIMDSLVTNSKNINDVINQLSDITSISSWGIYVGSQKENKVLSIDLLGKQNVYELKEIEKTNDLYFNNQFINQNINTDLIQPLNFTKYCHERSEDAKKRINKLNNFSDKEVLKALTKVNGPGDKNSVITPSTILSCVMNPTEGKLIYNLGVGPRTYQKSIQQITEIWSSPKALAEKSSRTTIKNTGEVYFNHLINAQISWDRKDYHQAVHHSQLAVDHSTKKQVIPSFFANVYISMSTNEKSMLKNCLKNFNDLLPLMSGIFSDYCKLFIFRLEKICFSKYEKPSFKNKYVEKVFLFEEKIPSLVFKKITNELTSPRLDLQDIIFLHPLQNDNSRISL